MNTTIYKRLFEIRIFHDYYLGDEDGDSFFAVGSKQKLRLQAALESGRYNVGNFLEIAPTPETRELIRNQRMRMVSTPMGFFIGLEVRQEEENGDKFYKPFIALDDDAPLAFSLKLKNELFFNFTNFPLEDRLPAICHFSNENGRKTGDAKVLPRRPQEKDGNANYQMGELVESGGKILEAIVKPDEIVVPLEDKQVFLPVSGDGYVNRSDKYLLPKKFVYNFRQNVSGNAEFKLMEKGAVVKSISKSFTEPVRFASLDFEKKEDEKKTPIPDGEYDLEVTATGFTDKRKVLLSNKLYDPGWFGVIVIRPKDSKKNLLYDLLDDEGRLIARTKNGSKEPHPQFDLRFLSRKAFWRYLSKEEFKVGEFPEEFLVQQTDNKKALFTKEPRTFSQNLTSFKKGVFLPNATAASLRLEGRTYISDIHLSAINKLLKE
jgi:hypothetical protein